MTTTALIIDDEPDIRELIALTLTRMGLEIHAAANLEEARHLLEAYSFDVCLTDMRLPDGNGVEFVKTIHSMHPQLPVAVITAHGNMDEAVDAMKNGAYDFVSKPVDINQLRKLVVQAVTISNSISKRSEEASNDNTDTDVANRPVDSTLDTLSKRDPLRADPVPKLAAKTLIGQSQPMKELRNMIAKVARTNAPVWITGESGTGKELIAKLIHQHGPRADAPFIAINCGAIPSELMESELFGHKKGSFTGAVNDSDGLFKRAEGGTLFLDEVAELPLHMQVKLLRAIQERSVRPVGGSDEIPVDVRILSASHKDLSVEVDQGVFRHDLYYRLNVISLRSPSLSERTDDIPELVEHLLHRIQKHLPSNQCTSLSHDAMQVLERYVFTGNVRELENILERAVALSDGLVIDVTDLGINTESKKSSNTNNSNNLGGAVRSMDDNERERLVAALEAARWNRKAAAVALGLTYRQLRYRIEQLGIEDNDRGAA
ncbi:MAG: sigma-54 dependent transcriptional regulator [Granulosicoccaceae bacterium]